MNAQLVKIDVAAADLGIGVRRIEQLVDGGTLLEKGLAWVFNLANDLNGDRRDLRFWRPEIIARSKGNDSRYSFYQIGWVIGRILPEKRAHFHAGEVDQIFQIRHNTRIDFGAELNGAMRQGRNFYERTTLAAFLERRWLGSVSARKTLSPDKAAPLQSPVGPQRADRNSISRVGNSRSTGSPANSMSKIPAGGSR